MSSTFSASKLGKSMSKIIRIYFNKSGQVDREQVETACEFLTEKRGVIILPTDTLYGLAARVDDSEALDRIYNLKGRDRNKPLAVCLSSLSDIGSIVEEESIDKRILPCLLPGPVTIVLKRNPALNPKLNPGHNLVGVRVPSHNFVTSICSIVGPLALTSANRSGESSPLEQKDYEELLNDVDCAFDNGSTQTLVPDANILRLQRLGSTVLDLSRKNHYTIIREGCALNRSLNILHRFGYKKSIDSGRDS